MPVRMTKEWTERLFGRMPVKFAEELLDVSELDGTDLIVPDEEVERLTQKYQAAHDEAINGGSGKIKGAGDLVAYVANPIARAIDAVLGTDMQNCGGCKERQEALNQALPFSKTIVVDDPQE